MKPRLKEKYDKEIVPALQKEFGFKNKMAMVFPEEIHTDNLDFFITTSKNQGISSELFSIDCLWSAVTSKVSGIKRRCDTSLPLLSLPVISS